MLRRFLLPALALGLLATEAAQAQTTPAPASRQAYRKVRKAERVLSKREQQAAEAQARVQAAQAARDAAAAQAPATTSGTSWGGWNNEPLPTAATSAPHRATGYNVSSAPGMPLNQVGHGVSTDYSGRPLPATPAVATTARR